MIETGEMRRSGRIPKEVAVRLIGWDAQGTEFVEETKTVLLSRHGAGIVSTYKLAVEQEMVLVYPARKNKETEIRIVGQIGSEGASYTYGVAFLDPDVDFWGIEFSPVEQDRVPRKGMTLQCSRCGRREHLNADSLELDIYAIQNGIFRDCKHCNHPTFWQQTTEEPSDVPGVTEAEPVSPKSIASSEACGSPEPFKVQRRYPRIKVNFTACVRGLGAEDNLVQCENVSRGGLCFKSSRRYYETAYIEVAAPYSPGSPCILVPAQIVYVHELPGEKMYRCGVQYLELTKDPLA